MYWQTLAPSTTQRYAEDDWDSIASLRRWSSSPTWNIDAYQVIIHAILCSMGKCTGCHLDGLRQRESLRPSCLISVNIIF